MEKFKKHHGGRIDLLRLGLRTLGCLVLVILASFLVRGTWGMYGKLVHASDGEEASRVELARLRAREVKVRASVEALSSDRGVEAEVRERYGVLRPGEGEIRVIYPVASTAPTSIPAAPWWARVWHALLVW